ncbi:MAG: prolipoprotein diacylglyceryl transferase [Myxococcota bacterium]|nr:prolipoprotein diacylglyceryl transferase [Myxococcota bacterium]
MGLFLYIPWFRAEALEIPTPWGTPIAIHPFGLLVATGVVLGAYLARWKAKQDGLHPETVMNLAGWVLVPGFICAHIFDDLAYRPELVAENPLHLLMIWEGISSFGGFFGAIGGALAWRHRRGLPGLAFADPIAFGFPLGWLFGRTGCFTVHDHPGRVTDFFLGVENYEVGWPPYQVRHDLGLYEVLWSIAVVLLFGFLARKQRPRGFYVALLAILYAPVRFGLDFLRATDIEQADARYFGFTPAHYAALALLAIGAIVTYFVIRKPWPEIPRWAHWPEPEPEVVESATTDE